MNKEQFYADLNRDFSALMAGETSFLATLTGFERCSQVFGPPDTSPVDVDQFLGEVARFWGDVDRFWAILAGFGTLDRFWATLGD